MEKTTKKLGKGISVDFRHFLVIFEALWVTPRAPRVPKMDNSVPWEVDTEHFTMRWFHFETRPYTRQHQLRAGGQEQHGSWAGAATEICYPFSSKRPKTRSDFGPTDRRTDRQCRHRKTWNKAVYTAASVTHVGQGHWWKLDHFLAWIPRLKRTGDRRTDRPTDGQTLL